MVCDIGAVILLVIMAFIALASIAYGNGNGQDDFILPPWGGGMVHCDPQLTDNIRLPVPTANATNNVGEVWYRHDFGGEKYGTYGIGIAGNGRIAACSFGLYDFFGSRLNPNDNLIIYDYYGNRLWSSGYWRWFNKTQYPWSLDPSACGSVPMIDIYDRVVACDIEKIILVNASDHRNIHVDWISYFPAINLSLRNPSIPPVPLSPTIVENRTIIVPTWGGPLYAFDVKTGARLASLSFWDNSSSESYSAVREMNWADFFTILSHPLDCPYHYDSVNHVVAWNSTVQYGIMPINPVFFEGTVMFKTDRNGVVAAVDTTNESILAMNSLGTPKLITGGKHFGTQNSACVKGKRVYLTTQFPPPNLLGRYRGNISGRLYAIDVNPDAKNSSDILKEAWHFDFPGQSQASPTLSNKTIYFDAFNGNYTTLNGSNRNPRIYAVYTNGTLRWKINYSNITGFSFAMDPRGGFWYNDMGIPLQGGGGRKLVHFSAENGSILEEINVTKLLHDTERVYPVSCMTICGTATYPIMIVSANHFLFHHGKWVIAINLTDNKLLWKVPIESPSNFNFASGQYTILNESYQYRVLFSTFSGGVMAIGSYPNCWFENVSYKPWDSPEDNNNYNDSVNITFSIKTHVHQDHAWVKTMLISQDHPMLCRYSTVKFYTMTSSGGQHTISITLPPRAPKGNYILKAYLYNSSGKLKRDLLHLADFKDFGIFTNDTYETGEFYLYPPRIINRGSQLALDTIFNGKIRASNLQHGTGTYRVYTAFRDPTGKILKTNDGSKLKAWWQFNKT